MNKLILDESCEIIEAEEFEEIPQEDVKMALNSMISGLIQTKWQSIDLLNGSIASMNGYNRDDIAAIIKNIISDEYIHIGQLEKALEMANTDAAAIEAGKEDVDDTVKATDNLPDLEIEDDDLEVEEESLDDMPSDDIDESLAKQIVFKKKEMAK